MSQFKYGHANALNWEEAALNCLKQIGKIKNENLGFLYITDHFEDEINQITYFFQQETGISNWVGTIAIGICATGQEYFNVPAIVAMVGEFPEGSFKVFTRVNEEDQSLEKFVLEHQSWVDSKIPLFGIVHANPRNSELPEMIVQLGENLGDGFLVGGLTSSHNQQSLHPQIANEVLVDDDLDISGVIFSSAVTVSTRLTQGCSIIGKRHEITEADRNILVRIDNLPALQVFKEDIGEEFSKDLQSVAGQIFTALPIQGSDMGDYMVRNIIALDPEHQLMAIGDFVSAGTPILFAKRDVRSAKEDLIRILNSLKHDLRGQKPKGGVYISCLGRGESLFGKDSQEMKLIQEVLGDFPLVGFFANGEISHQRLYGYTGILTLFV
ncbi:FIST C-terminal domain-containing protein [Candidatus Albibeggiatoa sp. nov. NOAA]|uniref:FIST signal transduction protein n=1 Tax=Candidatus Albibeggiatoa sp. nov. NOAA TaxID=3162724 RepID=UPI0032FB72E8|nr:FIST C-terminal domain-containing protein [Thiotrichaceae bacterium]